MPRAARLILAGQAHHIVQRGNNRQMIFFEDADRRFFLSALGEALAAHGCQLHAYVPLAELFGYTSDLRNVTSGTASFAMEPSHYAPVKEELADIRAAS